MLDMAREVIGTQPILALFLAIGVGYLVGQLSIGGFSLGAYLGMMIESRFITSFMSVNIVSATRGHDIAVALREHGFGVTETVGEGLNGKVIMLHSVVNRRDMPKMVQTIHAQHPEAFISVGEARSVHHGWIRGVRNQPTV